MAEIETKLQRWGNSFGIVVPIEIVRSNNLREGEDIKALIVKKSNVLRESFGSHKFKKSVEKLMKETDKALYNE